MRPQLGTVSMLNHHTPHPTTVRPHTRLDHLPTTRPQHAPDYASACSIRIREFPYITAGGPGRPTLTLAARAQIGLRVSEVAMAA
jgi:hypothetical protein